MLERARAYREEGYERCQSSGMKDAVDLVAAVMEAVPANQGLHLSSVLDTIDKKVEAAPGSGWKLPEGMDADQFLEHLIHRGALQPINADSLACPIPGLRSWLIDRTRPKAERPGPEAEFLQALIEWAAALASEGLAE